MHIPYFADFYHICICKIDEITPLKSTAFLSLRQRYTFHIPPGELPAPFPAWGVPCGEGDSGVPGACSGAEPRGGAEGTAVVPRPCCCAGSCSGAGTKLLQIAPT